MSHARAITVRFASQRHTRPSSHSLSGLCRALIDPAPLPSPPVRAGGYHQEDQFLGDLSAFLDEPLLASHDVMSPLPSPFFHAGPFMVYRNAPLSNGLYRRSSEWRSVVRAKEYRAFDEWWGTDITDDMAEVVKRERCVCACANANALCVCVLCAGPWPYRRAACVCARVLTPMLLLLPCVRACGWQRGRAGSCLRGPAAGGLQVVATG